jgi:LysM repeat protein
MSRKHGQTTYYIEGEGFVGDEAIQPASGEAGRILGAAPESSTALNPERAFRFTRMFPKLAAFRPALEDLIALGAAMDDTPNLNDHRTLPAGFTYLGQFLDHDVTFDQTAGLPEGVLTPEEIENGRTPSLDLDCLYGLGPAREKKPLYEADKLRMRIGRCSGVGQPGLEPESQPLLNDLPRGHSPANRLEATIGDPRNDENLAVAQTHLAFLKFHNVVVARFAETGMRGYELFEAARRTVVLHYQWIVLHDFLARVVEPAILAQVIRDGGRFFTPPTDKQPAMPIEFSVAAYRFGHSMIRDGYSWNRIFERAGLNLLFLFSGVNGNLAGQPTLPANWPIDWRRFYDFSGAPGVEPARLNLARSIDTALAIGLKTIPEFENEGARRPLAVRNLLRGHVVGLPSGQAVAEALSVPALTPAQLRSGALAQVVQKTGFDKETPLWYYILKEAELFHNGQRLGPVGSTLLAETFVALIKCSRTSVLSEANGNWRPTLPSLRPGHYTMVDMLLLVNDLNPLSAPIEPPPSPPPPQRSHVVQPGETLRSIAARFLGDERRWREIHELNKDAIANPDLIKPGLELGIPNG